MPLNFPDILARYDAFLIDLWGVVHDGTALYPGVADVLAQLHAQGKPVVFISNAPRVSAKAEATLTKLGIPRAHYKQVVTSGQVAHDLLRDDTDLFGTHYYYLGPSKDEDILADLPDYTRVATPEEADFVLNTGYEQDFQPHNEVLPLLKKLIALDLPLLCVNPDLEVVKQDGTQMLCAGALAGEYEDMGGIAEYVGKPHPAIYDVCRDLLPAGKLLAVGDNPLTDILGANEAEIDSLLITGGVLTSRHGGTVSEQQARDECHEENAEPTYILPAFRLA